jgi:hypothetical protein
MRKAAVCADGQHLNAQRFQLFEFDGNCRQFGGSDKGEITRVEADHNPLALIVRQLDVLKAPIYIRAQLKIWRRLANTREHLWCLLLDYSGGSPIGMGRFINNRPFRWFYTSIFRISHVNLLFGATAYDPQRYVYCTRNSICRKKYDTKETPYPNLPLFGHLW